MPMLVAHPITATEDQGTRIRVDVRNGRHQIRTSAGALRAQRLHGPDDRARVALVGQTALLLGGDQIVLDVEVGAGAWLELSEVAGTVAYHGRGLAASWRTRIQVGPGARLDYLGQPFVLSDGADVTRSLVLDLAPDAVAVIREAQVFGRAGEAGGRLDASTVLRRDGVEFYRDRARTDAAVRALPGVLAGTKAMHTVFALGPVPHDPPHHPPLTCVRVGLLDPESYVIRALEPGGFSRPRE